MSLKCSFIMVTNLIGIWLYSNNINIYIYINIEYRLSDFNGTLPNPELYWRNPRVPHFKTTVVHYYIGLIYRSVVSQFAASASFDRMRLKPPRGMKKRLPQIFGYVEIFHDEKWRHICTDGWKKENARVICGQLGFPDASDIGHMYSYLTCVL